MFLRPLATVLTLFLALPVVAQNLPEPQGPVILTITGNLAQTNGDGVARFDLAMFESLAQRETRTMTPWYEGPQRFTGPLISDLMALVGATGSALRVVAVNDYATTLPLSDLNEYPVILASRRNGETMPVRDKGPLFVIYPFDEFPVLRNEVNYSRSAWQVTQIEVLP
jgi:hypothetical protein